jgi:hypothetical protein
MTLEQRHPHCPAKTCQQATAIRPREVSDAANLKRYFVARTLPTLAIIFVALTALSMLFRIMSGDCSVSSCNRELMKNRSSPFEQKWRLKEPLYVQF